MTATAHNRTCPCIVGTNADGSPRVCGNVKAYHVHGPLRVCRACKIRLARKGTAIQTHPNVTRHKSERTDWTPTPAERTRHNRNQQASHAHKKARMWREVACPGCGGVVWFGLWYGGMALLDQRPAQQTRMIKHRCK